MALPWLTALKVIPWGDVIEHALMVLWAMAVFVLIWLSGYFFGRTDEIMRRLRQMEREAERLAR